MRLRSRLKYWLHGRCPGFAGWFRYHGVRVYFPRGSFVFKLACEQGIYEAQNLRVLLAAAEPGTCYFDLGANIGLMSVPLLQTEPVLRVVSVEPSPATLACLNRTARESPHAERWEVLGTAVADREGETEFFCSAPALAAFDGTQDTQRAGPTTRVRVPLTTLDRLWADRGRPRVSAVKIDIEGGEAAALRGGQACLAAERPVVLIEWSQHNLAALHADAGELLPLATELGYTVHACPALTAVTTVPQLRAHMRFGETFVLYPRP